MIGKLTTGRWIGAVALCALMLPGSSAAQITEEHLADTGAPNEAYSDATRRTGLDDEVLYIRPDATFSVEQVAEAEKKVQVERRRTEEEREADATANRWFWGIVFGVVLALLLVVFVMNAGGLTARFSTPDDRKRTEDDDERGRGPLGVEVDNSPVDQFLARLAAMSDRREALILLVSRALEAAAGSNKLRLGRSQTARDAVQALPHAWPYWGGMRDLVRQVELVHFGGRELSEEQWRECLAIARPILGARS